MKHLSMILLIAMAACATRPEAVTVTCEKVQLKDGTLTAILRNTGEAPVQVEVKATYFTSSGLELQGSPSGMAIDLAVGESRAIAARCPFATASEGRIEVRPRR